MNGGIERGTQSWDHSICGAADVLSKQAEASWWREEQVERKDELQRHQVPRMPFVHS